MKIFYFFILISVFIFGCEKESSNLPRQITFNTQFHYISDENCFSPDGNWLCFISYDSLAPRQIASLVGRVHIKNFKIDTIFQNIFPGSIRHFTKIAPSYTKNSHNIVFPIYIDSLTIAKAEIDNQLSGEIVYQDTIHLAQIPDIDSNSVINLANLDQFSYTKKNIPNSIVISLAEGEVICFRKKDILGNWQLFLLSPHSEDTLQLTTEVNGIGPDFHWHEQSRKIFFTTKSHIRLTEIDQQLPRFGFSWTMTQTLDSEPQSLCFSNDDEVFAFTREIGGYHQIFTFHLPDYLLN